MRRRFLLPGGAILLVAVACAGWWYHAGRVETQMRRAEQALARQDWEGVEEVARKLAASGYASHAAFLRGKAAFLQARLHIAGSEVEPQGARLLSQALQEFNQIEIQDEGPLHLEAAALSGQCLMYLRQPAEAVRHFLFVLDRWPDHLESRRALAVVYYDQGAFSQAIHHTEEWARLDPRDGRSQRFLGIIYQDMDLRTEAIAAFREALARDLDGQAAEAVKTDLAEVLVKQRQFDEAGPVLETCEPETRLSPKWLALRTECLLAQERGADARSLLDRAIARYPRQPELLRLQARVALQDQKPADAAEVLRRVIEAEPNDYLSRFQLAEAYQTLGREADAAQQRVEGKRLQGLVEELSQLNRRAFDDPWDAPLRRKIADLCDQLGKKELALSWRAAAERCPPRP